MTNTYNNISFLSNTFQTLNNNFIVGFYSNSYHLIRDNNVVKYSNHFVSQKIKTNLITSFNLNINNNDSLGITTYNNKFYIIDSNNNQDKFYITDYTADKVYIYSNTGIYLSSFNLYSSNNNL